MLTLTRTEGTVRKPLSEEAAKRCKRDARNVALASLVLITALAGGPRASEAQAVDAGRFFPVEGPRLAGADLVWIPAYRTDLFG